VRILHDREPTDSPEESPTPLDEDDSGGEQWEEYDPADFDDGDHDDGEEGEDSLPLGASAGASRFNSRSNSHSSSAAGPSTSGRWRVSHSGSGPAQGHGANMMGLLPSTPRSVASTGSVGSWGTVSTNPNRRHSQLSHAGSTATSESGTDVLNRLTGFPLDGAGGGGRYDDEAEANTSLNGGLLFAQEGSDNGRSQRIRSNSNASSAAAQALSQAQAQAQAQAEPSSTSSSRRNSHSRSEARERDRGRERERARARPTSLPTAAAVSQAVSHPEVLTERLRNVLSDSSQVSQVAHAASPPAPPSFAPVYPGAPPPGFVPEIWNGLPNAMNSNGTSARTPWSASAQPQLQVQVQTQPTGAAAGWPASGPHPHEQQHLNSNPAGAGAQHQSRKRPIELPQASPTVYISPPPSTAPPAPIANPYHQFVNAYASGQAPGQGQGQQAPAYRSAGSNSANATSAPQAHAQATSYPSYVSPPQTAPASTTISQTNIYNWGNHGYIYTPPATGQIPASASASASRNGNALGLDLGHSPGAGGGGVVAPQPTVPHGEFWRKHGQN
jgi:hypothetical protein